MRYKFEDAVDLTHDLANGMPIYPGNPQPDFERYETLEKNGVNLTRLTLGSHTGTHTDAPRHFIADGTTIDKIPVSKLVGEAYVADLSFVPLGNGITAEDLQRALGGEVRPDDIVICYTGCSEKWGDERMNSNYTYLTEGAAQYLASRNVRAVGIDFLSVEKFKSPQPVAHRVLLGRGMFLIETITSAVKQFVGQRILLVCLPIKILGGDAAPCRVIAVPITND
jgi:arylformamidase